MSFTPTYIIVGEAPSKDLTKKNLDVALACRALKRRPVAGTMSWLRQENRRLFNFTMYTTHVNLLDYWPGSGPKGKGSQFPMDEARARAELFCTNVVEPAIVTVEGRKFCAFEGRKFDKPSMVLLSGHRVASAFHLRREYWIVDPECEQVAGLPAVVVPHPSGINRWWNEPENREFARIFLEGLGEVC